MTFSFTVLVVIQTFIWCLTLTTVDSKTCNILDYGAKGDGKTDDSSAVRAAIKDCGIKTSSANPPILLFPSKYSFKTGPFAINGNDNELAQWATANSKIQLGSNTRIINGITSPNDWPSNTPAFIAISYVSHFTLEGQNAGFYNNPKKVFTNSSLIDGRGSPWWNNNVQSKPKLITIRDSKNVFVHGLTLQNSMMFHLDVSADSGTISNMTITAPLSSPNTDAMDISGSGFVISDCYLATGDDNIAIKPNAQSMHISNVICGHGHGTSIGSIGENNGTGYVSDISFENMFYSGTTNVARVKTWQGGHGYARNISYKNIQFENVENPVRINQYYCPGSQSNGPCANQTATVNISGISFENFSGTQTKGYAGQILCSDSVPCSNLLLKNITVTAATKGDQNVWQCWEAAHSHSVNVEPALVTQGNCNWNTNY